MITDDERRKIVDERKKLNLCDGNCNACPIVNHPNNRMITRILNVLYNKNPDIYVDVEYRCPNLTVCFNCHIDDFVHRDGCHLGDQDEK